jgi:hypothetical protein
MTEKHLILRTCNANMTSRNGFKWPRSGHVAAPDWNPAPECGNGLHGFLRGEGNGGLADWSSDAVWLVAEVETYVDLEGKVKFPAANVIFAGSRLEATAVVKARYPDAAVIGANVAVEDRRVAVVGYGGTATAGHQGTATAGNWGTATAGDCGTATAGDCGTATAGVYGTATTGNWGTATTGNWGTATAGDCGTATAGDCGTATAGYRGTATAGNEGTATAGNWGTATAGTRGTATAGYGGTATAGYRGTATAGDRGTATAGNRGTATAGEGGMLQIYYYDRNDRRRIATAYVGENGIQPNVKYRLDGNAKFVEA